MVHKVRYLPVLKRGGVLLIESSDNCISQSSSFTLLWKKEGVTLLPNYSEIFGLFFVQPKSLRNTTTAIISKAILLNGKAIKIGSMVFPLLLLLSHDLFLDDVGKQYIEQVVLEYSIVIAFDAPLRTQGSNLGPGIEDKCRGQKDSVWQYRKVGKLVKVQVFEVELFALKVKNQLFF